MPFLDNIETKHPVRKVSSKEVVKTCGTERNALRTLEGNARVPVAQNLPKGGGGPLPPNRCTPEEVLMETKREAF